MSSNFKKRLSLLMATVLLSLCGFTSQALAVVVWHTANDTNATISEMLLINDCLGNEVFNNLSQLGAGGYKYNFGAVIFTAQESGSYTLGQTYASVDTIMIIYSNVFDPANPGRGAMAGNDDTSQAAHQTATGDYTLNVEVGGTDWRGPQITCTLVAGQTYTLVVSTYDPEAPLDLPFDFYSTGNVIFSTYIPPTAQPSGTNLDAFGNTYNQRGITMALNNMGNNPLRDAIMLLNGSVDMDQLMNSLSGEIYATMPIVLVNQDTRMRGRLLRQAQKGAENANVLLAFEPQQFVTAGGKNTGWNFWVEGGGDFSRYDSTKNTGKAEFYGPELLIGADVFFADNWQAGVAVRYSDKDLEVHSRDAKSDIQSYTFGAYLSKGFYMGEASALRFTAGGLVSYHDLSSERQVKALHERLEADHNARSWSIFMEAAYIRPLTSYLTLEPFANVAYNGINNGAFKETGGTSALSLRSETFDNVDTQFGLRAAVSVVDWAALYGELAWQHTFGDVKHKSHVSFATHGGAFDIKGSVMNRDAAMVNLGVNMSLKKGIDLAVGYDGSIGDRGQSHGGSARLTFAF